MPFLAEIGSATFALTTALVITIGLILWQTQRQWRQTFGRPHWSDESEHWPATPPVTAEDLSRWEVRMHELARDLQGQLDTKIALVAELVTEADRVARRLQALLGQVNERTCSEVPLRPNQGENLSSLPSTESPVSSPGVNLSVRTLPNAPPKEYGGGQSVNNLCPLGESFNPDCPQAETGRLRSGEGFTDKAERLAQPTESPICQKSEKDNSNRFSSVYELLAAGLSSHEIATQTGFAVGEVELVEKLWRLRNGLGRT